MMGGGGFRHDTWWIHAPGDNPRTARYASAHESHHQQLEATTAFGNLTRIAVHLRRVGAPVHPTIVADLIAASRATHEAFASWVPAFVLGWTRDEVGASYPEYLRDFDAMDSLVGGVQSPYLRLHFAHATARLCMQADVLGVALKVGFAGLRLSDLRSTQRPDARLHALRRRPPSVNRMEADLSVLLARRVRSGESSEPSSVISRRALGLLRRRNLTAEMLAPEERDVFGWINAAVYALLAEHAGALNLEALGHEEHVVEASPVLAAAQMFAGVELDLVGGETAETAPFASGPRGAEAHGVGERHVFRVQAHAKRAVASVDFEQFSVADPLNARWVDPVTPLAHMVAGIEDPHLFLALRTAQQVHVNYRFGDSPRSLQAVDGLRGAISERADVALIRRTVVTGEELAEEVATEAATTGKRSVELLDVTSSMPARSLAPAPVVTSVAMSLLRFPVAQRLADYLRPETSTLLVDMPLEPHLTLWLSSPGSRVRWVLLRTEGHGRVVPVLILRVENEGGRSHLMIKPVSHAAAGIFRAGFEEVDPSGEHLVMDPGLLDDDPELLNLTLAHLIGEEVWFGVAG